MKGLLAYKPAHFSCGFSRKSKYPGKLKALKAVAFGYARPSGIKRTRKRLAYRAAMMDHTSYEWSQWWSKQVRKPKRHKR